MVPDEEIRQLEARALNALPALEEEAYDGWVLRATRGYTGRANSAAPLHDGRIPLVDKLVYTEAWYRRRNLPAMIRLTPAGRPAGLDYDLEEGGYVLRDEGVSVQIRSLQGIGLAPSAVEVTSGRVSSEWLAALAGFQSRVAHNLDTVREVFDRLPASRVWAMIRREGSPAAIGRAVLEGGDLGLFDVITHPGLRRGGFATEITAALLRWGIERGAEQAYLQVVPSNAPAIRLYAKLGFEEAYRYWYRVKREV
jgi:ribosomal protein S18 acetylase RimI-like enzyme